MPVTYVNIASTTVTGSAAASVTFSGINQTYTDLMVLTSVRANGGATTGLMMNINGSSANTYSTMRLLGNGSAASVSSDINDTRIMFTAGINPSSYTASVFANGMIYISSYTSSTNKQIYLEGAVENAATTAQLSAIAGLRRDTSAITSLTFTSNIGNIEVGSTFYLYGIKNS